MTKPLLALLSASILSAALVAQEVPPPVAQRDGANSGRQAGPTPVPRRGARAAKATPAPATSPDPQKPGFFERVFGPKRTTPAPTPATTPKPTPRARKPRPDSANAAEKKDAAEKKGPARSNPKPQKKADEPDTEEVAETPEPPAGDPASTPPPSTPAAGKKLPKGKRGSGKPADGKSATPDPASGDPDVQEKAKYEEVKAKALEDAEIQELKKTADSAPDEAEGRQALRAYNKALFNKMRRLDPSLKDRIDRMETGVMSRLGE